jgi:hypothetical protein
MKVVCAWCTLEIGEVTHQDDSQSFEVTHGICKSCKDYFFGDRHLTLDKFLNRLEAPVLMVNAQGEVVLANDRALQLLQKDLAAVSGFRAGMSWSVPTPGCREGVATPYIVRHAPFG